MIVNTISIEVSGKEIIDAVIKIANKPMIDRHCGDGGDHIKLGQVAPWPSQNIHVTGDDKEYIKVNDVYSEIKVWQGLWTHLTYGSKDTGSAAENLDEFTKKLEEALREKDEVPEYIVTSVKFDLEATLKEGVSNAV